MSPPPILGCAYVHPPFQMKISCLLNFMWTYCVLALISQNIFFHFFLFLSPPPWIIIVIWGQPFKNLNSPAQVAANMFFIYPWQHINEWVSQWTNLGVCLSGGSSPSLEAGSIKVKKLWNNKKFTVFAHKQWVCGLCILYLFFNHLMEGLLLHRQILDGYIYL